MSDRVIDFILWFIFYASGFATVFFSLGYIPRDPVIGICMLVAGSISMIAARDKGQNREKNKRG